MPRDDCEHAPYNDPRREGRCVKCGGIIPPTTRLRNPEVERELVQLACRRLGSADPEAFVTHMQARSASLSGEYVNDPMMVKLTDHLKAGREEGPDWGNRLAWWLEENPEHPEFDRKLRALALVVEAYELCAEESG